MLDKPISPLRQRMIDDMTARRFNEHTRRDYVRHVRTNRQRGDGGVDGRRADLLLRHMQLKAAKVLARGAVRRTAEEGRPTPEMPEIAEARALLAG